MNQLNGWIVSLIDDNESCNPNGMTDDDDRDMALHRILKSSKWFSHDYLRYTVIC